MIIFRNEFFLGHRILPCPFTGQKFCVPVVAHAPDGPHAAFARREGITIMSKVTSMTWKGVKLNIVDTPGHADFGGACTPRSAVGDRRLGGVPSLGSTSTLSPTRRTTRDARGSTKVLRRCIL